MSSVVFLNWFRKMCEVILLWHVEFPIIIQLFIFVSSRQEVVESVLWEVETEPQFCSSQKKFKMQKTFSGFSKKNVRECEIDSGYWAWIDFFKHQHTENINHVWFDVLDLHHLWSYFLFLLTAHRISGWEKKIQERIV